MSWQKTPWKISLLLSSLLHLCCFFLVENYLPISLIQRTKTKKILAKIALEDFLPTKFSLANPSSKKPSYNPKKEFFSADTFENSWKKEDKAKRETIEPLHEKNFLLEEKLLSSSFEREEFSYSPSKIDTIRKTPFLFVFQEERKGPFAFSPEKQIQENTPLFFSFSFKEKEPLPHPYKPCLVSETESISEGSFSISLPTPSPKELPSVYQFSSPLLPSLKELNTLSCADLFDTEVLFFPDTNGYVFVVTLIPKLNEELSPIPQNFFFLLDTSNTIQNDRLKASAKGIYKALSFLEEKDFFNVIHYDNKMQRMALNSVPCNKNERLFAKEFLDSVKLGSIFSSADPFKPLNTLLFEKLSEEKVSHIFLITSGEGVSNQNKTPFFIHDWTSKNQRKFCLHILALQSDQNLPLLDAFANLNRGKLYLASNKNGLKRKLRKMVKSVQSPIAKDLAIQAIPSPDQRVIELHPSNQTLPILFEEEPFVIWGKVETLEDFTLFIQGKNKNAWLNLKKRISLKEAKEAPEDLKNKWAIQKAYSLYANYFKTEDPSYLIKANQLLKFSRSGTIE